MRSPFHHIRAGLTHANPLVVAATCTPFLLLAAILVRLVAIIAGDLWVFVIALMQP